ncbi:MAG: RDD family protein [Anaeromyxobacter sp.]
MRNGTREPKREESPYPKANLTLRGLARAVDFALAFALMKSSVQVGPLLAALYLLSADGLMNGQSLGKRLLGVRAVVVPRRAPATWHDSWLRNAPFALVVVFLSVPVLWPVLLFAGMPILGLETWFVLTDRLGIRVGDIFADTQVVDGKVLAKTDAVEPLAPAAPAPPGSSARAA